MKKFFRNLNEIFYEFVIFFCDHWGKILVWGLVLAFFIALANVEQATFTHEFKEGDVACMVITGDRVQVIESNRHKEKVAVRIAITSSTNSDGVVTTAREYDWMRIYDYELENCK